jgi:hypothetical protein
VIALILAAIFSWSAHTIKDHYVIFVSYPTEIGVKNILTCIELDGQDMGCTVPARRTDIFSWEWRGVPVTVVHLQQRLEDGRTRWLTAEREADNNDLLPCWPNCL